MFMVGNTEPRKERRNQKGAEKGWKEHNGGVRCEQKNSSNLRSLSWNMYPT